MNKNNPEINYELLTYQTVKLKNLIKEVVQCCDDRKLYESNKFDLPYAELKCLLLFIGERYLTSKNISEKLDIAKSRVTKIINGLRGKGLVERIDDPKDARMKLISLTPSGQTIAERIEAFHEKIHKQILTQMSDNERKGVLFNLELLRSSMEAVKATLI